MRLGYVSGVWGVRGAVKLFLYNPTSTAFAQPAEAVLVLEDGSRRTVVLQAARGAGKRIVGLLTGVSDRAGAEALQGAEIVLPVASLPALDLSEFYHRDLLGLPVITQDGRELGVLHEIYSTGEVDTWVVRGSGGEHYLPALSEVVVRIQVGDRIVVSNDVGETL